ncbi:RNA-binding protein 8A [Yarrowia sp. C11]|nr:RNA-binding protein 8A [Yarrowia sp. E02]KAG5372251.1 RNA-binding protein 8A [Yarrowia sp. C11]
MAITENEPTPLRSTEGWIIIVDNLHPEISEEDLTDFYSTYGDVQVVHVNLDRRTGYAKGYALLQFGTKDDADTAIEETNGVEFLEHFLEVAYAFHEADTSISQHRIRGSENRSRSPEWRS